MTQEQNIKYLKEGYLLKNCRTSAFKFGPFQFCSNPRRKKVYSMDSNHWKYKQKLSLLDKIKLVLAKEYHLLRRK